MTLWMILLATVLAAGPTNALIEQRQAVEEAASAVAKARQEGARRQELARLMATYRALAEKLAELERQTFGADDTRAGRSTAQRQLSAAMAEGGEATEARQLLGEWLGKPEERVTLLRAALEAAIKMEASDLTRDLTRDIVLDVADQCQALLLVTTYDAYLAGREAARLRLRAGNLVRKTSPGQGESMVSTIQARRLEEEAKASDQKKTEVLAVHEQAVAIQQGVRTRLEQKE